MKDNLSRLLLGIVIVSLCSLMITLTVIDIIDVQRDFNTQAINNLNGIRTDIVAINQLISDNSREYEAIASKVIVMQEQIKEIESRTLNVNAELEYIKARLKDACDVLGLENLGDNK